MEKRTECKPRYECDRSPRHERRQRIPVPEDDAEADDEERQRQRIDVEIVPGRLEQTQFERRPQTRGSGGNGLLRSMGCAHRDSSEPSMRQTIGNEVKTCLRVAAATFC